MCSSVQPSLDEYTYMHRCLKLITGETFFKLFYLFFWSAAFQGSQQQNQFSLSKYFSFPEGSGIICGIKTGTLRYISTRNKVKPWKQTNKCPPPSSSLDDTHRVTAWLPSCWTHCKIQNTFLSCSFWSYTRIRWCTDSHPAPSSHSTFIACTFSVFVCVLEGLDQPESLIHRSPHWKIVHGDLPQDAFIINDEEPSETFGNKI